MAWVAFDRAATDKQYSANPATRQKYRRIADEIHRNVCENAVDQERGCFVQAYGSTHLDASLLLIPVVGFLPAEDERVRNTVSGIEQRLMADGLVLRYETCTNVDGLSGDEGAFLACSFWLVDNYILQGNLKKQNPCLNVLFLSATMWVCWQRNMIPQQNASLATSHKHLVTWL